MKSITESITQLGHGRGNTEYNFIY